MAVIELVNLGKKPLDSKKVYDAVARHLGVEPVKVVVDNNMWTVRIELPQEEVDKRTKQELEKILRLKEVVL